VVDYIFGFLPAVELDQVYLQNFALIIEHRKNDGENSGL
jgi:hypothetical protein